MGSSVTTDPRQGELQLRSWQEEYDQNAFKISLIAQEFERLTAQQKQLLLRIAAQRAALLPQTNQMGVMHETAAN